MPRWHDRKTLAGKLRLTPCASTGTTTSTYETTPLARIGNCGSTCPVAAWLVVTRNTRTHEIIGVEAARDVALARGK